MANWLRTVSNPNSKYCVDMMIDGTWQRVSNWYDTLAEAQQIAQGYINTKATATADAAANATQDAETKTKEDIFPDEPV